ncbi:MAG: LytTR family DNA-binding domain-containing protein [Bacteroidota bacterium]
MTIHTLIVDDESLARERIHTLLKSEKEFRVVGECSNGKEALRSIEEKEIDLVFLDIEMPALDGIGLLEKLPAEKLPLVIFTTAFDLFAVRAFELNAIDYLLKPFTKKRFQDSLERVKEKFRSGDMDLYMSQMLATIQSVAKKTDSDKIVVKSEGKIRFLPASEILWIESDANYLRLHTSSESVVIRDTMTNFSARLDPSKFLRLHRTVIANTAHIVELKQWFNDEYIAILHNGTQLPVGRTYRKSVSAFFKL